MTPSKARWIGLTIAAFSVGCGGGTDALGRELAALRSELVKMRADQSVLTDRLAAVERNSRSIQPPVTPRSSPGGGDRPSLAVVHVDPGADAAPPRQGTGEPAAALLQGDEDASADADAAGPRPLLRSTPDGGVVAVADHEGVPARKPDARAPVRKR